VTAGPSRSGTGQRTTAVPSPVGAAVTELQRIASLAAPVRPADSAVIATGSSALAGRGMGSIARSSQKCTPAVAGSRLNRTTLRVGCPRVRCVRGGDFESAAPEDVFMTPGPYGPPAHRALRLPVRSNAMALSIRQGRRTGAE
jgi:hypothetical protein